MENFFNIKKAASLSNLSKTNVEILRKLYEIRKLLLSEIIKNIIHINFFIKKSF
jgi:hypothetical protein